MVIIKARDLMSNRPVMRAMLTHPFELLIAVWSLLAGIPMSFGVRLSKNASSHLPGLLFNAWGLMLACSGATILCGLLMFFMTRSTVRKVAAIRMEQCGWSLMCCGVGLFAIVIISLGLQGAIYTMTTYMALIGAGALRISSLGKAAQAYKRVIRDVVTTY